VVGEAALPRVIQASPRHLSSLGAPKRGVSGAAIDHDGARSTRLAPCDVGYQSQAHSRGRSPRAYRRLPKPRQRGQSRSRDERIHRCGSLVAGLCTGDSAVINHPPGRRPGDGFGRVYSRDLYRQNRSRRLCVVSPGSGDSDVGPEVPVTNRGVAGVYAGRGGSRCPAPRARRGEACLPPAVPFPIGDATPQVQSAGTVMAGLDRRCRALRGTVPRLGRGPRHRRVRGSPRGLPDH
jgi:hypothetical protein